MCKYFLIALLLSSIKVFSQDVPISFDKENTEQLIPYFKTNPVDRTEILLGITESVKAEGLVTRLGDVERVIVLDLRTLSGSESYLAFSWISEHGSGYFWYDESKLNDQFALWNKSIKTQDCLKISFADGSYSLLPDTLDFIKLVVSYVNNAPVNRIKFISENLDSLPPGVIGLIQLDLNSIFEVYTPVFIIDGSINISKLLISD